MLSKFDRVQILNDALPFIKKLSGSIIVIKYGGAAMTTEKLKQQVIENILFLSSIGIKLVLIHGGGPIINSWLRKNSIEPKFHNGIRITDKQTMEIVEMVLVGKVNKELVALLNKKDSCAIGLSGKDGKLIVASKLSNEAENFVGKVQEVNNKLLTVFLDKGYIPVITSIALGKDGQTYNINADTVASAIARSLQADKLILLTDTPGIMKDINEETTLYKTLKVSDVQNLKINNIIFGGMIPKVDCCIDALEGNVKSAHIIDGRVEHALLLELFTVTGVGSTLTL